MGNPRRKRLRLQAYDYSTNGAYFITICAQNKQHLFGKIIGDTVQLNDAGKMLETEWQKIPNYFIHAQLDEYIVMPNHFHGIIIRASSSLKNDKPLAHSSITDIIGAYKSMTTNKYIKGVKDHQWPTFKGRLWQRNYYEHVIRDDESLCKIREYIMNNPLNWHLDEMNS